MISNLLNTLYNLNIKINIKNNDLKIVYQDNTLTEKLKQQLKTNKQKIITRFLENKIARDKGFNIYGHGIFYEFRYGFGSYIFIERQSDGLISAWRANYGKGDDTPYKIIPVVKNKTFSEGFEKVVGFVDWLETRRK